MKEYILLIPNKIKKEIIKIIREKYYNYNIKFMSLEDFIKKYTFDYNNKTIYFLMKKYNFNYDTANIYLKNLYYINNNLENNKMNKLKEIKKYLDDNKSCSCSSVPVKGTRSLYLGTKSIKRIGHLTIR